MWYVYQVTSCEGEVVSTEGSHINQWDKVLVSFAVNARAGKPFSSNGEIMLSLDQGFVCRVCSHVQTGTVPA